MAACRKLCLLPPTVTVMVGYLRADLLTSHWSTYGVRSVRSMCTYVPANAKFGAVLTPNLRRMYLRHIPTTFNYKLVILSQLK